MKYRILRAGTALIIILSLLTTMVFASANTIYTNTRQLADNLQYINTISYSASPGRMESFALRMTGPGDAYPIVMNGDTVYGALTISTIVGYAESLGFNVLAAVNSDFFSTQTGVPLGIVIEDGVYKSSPSGRNAVSFGYDGGVYFTETPSVGITLFNNGNADGVAGNVALDGAGETSGNYGRTVSLEHFNKFRTEPGGMYLFSDAFSTVSTRTTAEGWFVRFKILEGTPSVSGEMTLKVTETLVKDGTLEIGEGELILSAVSGVHNAEFEKFSVGDIVNLTTTCEDTALLNARYATGGGDMLVSNGVKVSVDGWDKTLMPRAPRTALGVRADGTVISYVIDGRNSEHSVGMTPDELADEMLLQGCIFAVNFDGGGSTAMSLRIPGSKTAAVISKPSDGSERRCSTYILFVTDKTPGGPAKNLSLKNDGVIVLSGASVDLSYAASDGGYMTAAVPDDIAVVPSLAGALVDGTRYTAGDMAGTDMLTLHSPSTGASGAGNIFVITTPTSITPTKKDSSARLASIKLLPGETLRLDVTATYYRRAVTAQIDSFDYTVTGNIGEFTEPGVFTAGLLPLQKGTITVSAGAKTAEIEVEIGGFTDMEDHWAKEFVNYLASGGIVRGVTDITYGPELEIKRGDFVLMLYRAAGEPNPAENGTSSESVAGTKSEDEIESEDGLISEDGADPVDEIKPEDVIESEDGVIPENEIEPADNGFSDVPEDSYYAKAIAWAKEMGIAQGTGDGKFDPDSPLLRQQAFTFVYRFMGNLNIEFDDGTADNLEGFLDAGSIAEYAQIPTATLVSLGIVGGADGNLTPQSAFTRAQMAKTLAVTMQLQPPYKA